MNQLDIWSWSQTKKSDSGSDFQGCQESDSTQKTLAPYDSATLVLTNNMATIGEYLPT